MTQQPARKRRDIRDRMSPAVLTSWERVGSDDLAVFRIENAGREPFFNFRAGQYAQIAFSDQPEHDPRPRQFSIASSPRSLDHLEFYAILVRNSPENPGGLGVFTGTLWDHKIGDEILVMGPAGRFDLTRTSEPEIFCIATGTGLAPFISMVRDMWDEYRQSGPLKRRMTIIHAVSYTRELGYRKLLEEMAGERDFGLLYIPSVSRPDQDEDWNVHLSRGRANDVLRLLLGHPKSGRVDPVISDEHRDALAERLAPEISGVYICGNPDMIADCSGLLVDGDFRTGGAESQVIMEDYW